MDNKRPASASQTSGLSCWVHNLIERKKKTTTRDRHTIHTSMYNKCTYVYGVLYTSVIVYELCENLTKPTGLYSTVHRHQMSTDYGP